MSDDLTYFTVENYDGNYINFEDGFRRTVAQPTSAPNTIWLIGNSTMVCQQVADAYTIASQLQVLVGNTYRVVNVGMGGAGAIHEFYRLRTLPLLQATKL